MDLGLKVEEISGEEESSGAAGVKPTTISATSCCVEDGRRALRTVTETTESKQAVVPAGSSMPTITTQAFVDDAGLAAQLEGTTSEFRRVKVYMTPEKKVICGKCARYLKVQSRTSGSTSAAVPTPSAAAQEGDLEYEIGAGLHVHRHLRGAEQESHFHKHQRNPLLAAK